MEKIPTRTEAFDLLCEYNQQDSLIRHGLAVEAVMRYFAEKAGEDVEKWSVIGLCHDLDYEQYPEQHCTMTRKILEQHKWPESYIRAIISHGWGLCSDVEPIEYLEKVLFATDELTGLITACVVMVFFFKGIKWPFVTWLTINVILSFIRMVFVIIN